MADPTNYQRIVLNMSTPYARRGGRQIWSVKFNLSGDTPLDYADFTATAHDLWLPISKLVSPNTSYIGARYYEIGSNINTWTVDYAVGGNIGDWSAYSGTMVETQLEVVVIARARCGTSSLGRAKYLMKHIHDVAQGADAGVLATIDDPAAVMAKWITGSGPDELVPVDPIGGAVGTPWQIDAALYTRQMRRGERPPS